MKKWFTLNRKDTEMISKASWRTTTTGILASEIERLWHELDGARLAYRGASYDRDRMRSERDELRREICGYSYDDPHIVAKDRGWDCFKENAND